MAYRLTDGRDKDFKMETENIEELLEYLDYPKSWSFEKARETLEQDNEGMDFYHLEEV